MNTAKKVFVGCAVGCAGGFAVVAFTIFVGAAVQVASEDRQEQQSATATTPVRDTEARLRHDIESSLSRSNRSVRRVSSIGVSDGSVSVAFAVDDNLTQNMIRSGIRRDIVKILKAAQKSGYDFTVIKIEGSFPLVDKFGTSTESAVVRAVWSRATVDRINWPSFLREDVYDIADSSWLHPAITGE